MNVQVQLSAHRIERHDSAQEISETEISSSGHNHVQSKNGSTKMALKSMVESLVTPLDLNVNVIHPSIETPNSPTQLPDAPDSGNEIKPSSSRTFFRWSGKKRLSKSQANIATLVHRDSVVTQSTTSTSSTDDVDIAAFQRELINLPTFVMDTPPVDVSPVFSRCSSVPENLASRNKSNVLGGSSGKLESFGMETDSENNLAAATFMLGGSINNTNAVTESLVTITTTDMDNITNESTMISEVESPPGGATNILVHFEAPSSPQLSTSSQSPDTVFHFPTIPSIPLQTLPGTTSNNFLSPHQEYTVSVSGIPGPLAAVPCPAVQTVSPASDRVVALHTPKTHVTTTPCELPMQHRGVLKVFESWVQQCHMDLDGNSALALETRDFLKRLSVLGHEYKSWCQGISSKLHLEVRLRT